jgi:hypothetical protein
MILQVAHVQVHQGGAGIKMLRFRRNDGNLMLLRKLPDGNGSGNTGYAIAYYYDIHIKTLFLPKNNKFSPILPIYYGVCKPVLSTKKKQAAPRLPAFLSTVNYFFILF